MGRQYLWNLIQFHLRQQHHLIPVPGHVLLLGRFQELQ